MSLDTSRSLFGTVTSINPPKVRPDGDSTPLDVPLTALESVGVGDRVMLAFQGRQLTITGVVVPNGGAWVTPALGGSWVSWGSPYRGAGYRKLPSGEVTARGLIKLGVTVTPIFTFPEGYRPGAAETFLGVASNGTARIDVASNGEISVLNYMAGGTNAYVSLSQVRFDAHA